MYGEKSNRWQRLRAWINRDDGKMFQVGNEDLNLFEAIGYFLLIAALIVYLLHDKADFESVWIGWSALAFGIGFVYYGTLTKLHGHRKDKE